MDVTRRNAIAAATARLRKAFPDLSRCDVVIDGIGNGNPRFSARLDLRLPETQVLLCGKPSSSLEGGLNAAFAEARERLSGMRLRSQRRAA